MLFGIGIDIEEHGRFLKYVTPHENKYLLLSVFTPREIANYSQFGSHHCFALSFSCKEAFFKALGISWNNSEILWTNIELIFDDMPEKKQSTVYFSGFARQYIQQQHIQLPVDYSYRLDEQHVIFEAYLTCRTN